MILHLHMKCTEARPPVHSPVLLLAAVPMVRPDTLPSPRAVSGLTCQGHHDHHDPGSSQLYPLRPTWLKSISWAQQNLRNPSLSNKVHQFFFVFFLKCIFSVNIYSIIFNMTDHGSILAASWQQLGASPRPACAIAQADWLVLDQRLQEPGIFQHVSTCLNIIGCLILETF